MKRELEYELPDGDGLMVDFDNDPERLARYEVVLGADEDADAVIVVANRRACLAFARLFAQLAERGGHVHVGDTEEDPSGPGLRIVVDENGRMRRTRQTGEQGEPS